MTTAREIMTADVRCVDSVSAYLALDQHLPAFPGWDLALLWDEERGWSAAIETHSGEDLIVVSYPDCDTVVPPSDLVVRFVDGLLRGHDRTGRPDAPAIRAADSRPRLAELLPARMWSE